MPRSEAGLYRVTPDTTNLAARIDRDRRERESDLLWLLLLLFGTARTHAYAALKVGSDAEELLRAADRSLYRAKQAHALRHERRAAS